MVQDKKQFSSGNKKPMSQDLDRKSQSGVADRSAETASKTGSMKQNDLKDKSQISKRDIGSRK